RLLGLRRSWGRSCGPSQQTEGLQTTTAWDRGSHNQLRFDQYSCGRIWAAFACLQLGECLNNARIRQNPRMVAILQDNRCRATGWRRAAKILYAKIAVLNFPSKFPERCRQESP